MVNLELGRHKPETGGFCLDLVAEKAFALLSVNARPSQLGRAAYGDVIVTCPDVYGYESAHRLQGRIQAAPPSLPFAIQILGV